MMTDNPSSVPIQRPQYNFVHMTQGLGGPEHEPRSPPARYSSTMPVGYDDPPHLATGPRGHTGIEGQRQLQQLDGHPTPGMTQRIPFALGPPRLGYDAPAITEFHNGGPPSQVPLPYNIAGYFQGNPSVVYSGVPVTEDLKSLASRYLHSPGSNVDTLRIRRRRSGTVKVLIFLNIPVASVALQLEQFVPAILEVPNDGPPAHVPPLNVPRPSQGNHSIGYPVNYGMSDAEDIEDLASRYLGNPGSHVNKLRMRRSRSGAVKVLIVLEIDNTMKPSQFE